MKWHGWEGWHFHHLARRAKTFGLGSGIIKTLEAGGWSLIKKGEIPDALLPSLEQSLKRLAEIRNFAKTCDYPNCPICERVVREFFTGNFVDEPWKLSIELYRWQKEAKQLWWENGGRGIVKVITGAGKTIFALSLISDLFNSIAYKDGGLKTIIVVPTSVLLDQWLIEVIEKLHVSRERIGVFYGKEKDDLKGKDIIIYVVNSARKYLKTHFEQYFRGNDIFLIADECHRYGSKENAKIFEIPYSYTLGLSATPERYGDYGLEEVLIPNLGKVIYAYTYRDALKDNIIPPYKLTRISVKLTPKEEKVYTELTKKINKVIKSLASKHPDLEIFSSYRIIKELNRIKEETGDKLIPMLSVLLNRRKSIIHLSESKLRALKWLFKEENLLKDKVIIFHERIDVVEHIFEYLKENGFKVGVYHSEMPLQERIKNISEFKDGKIKILVSCRALDEGFDVPSADTGIIVAGTSSVRQWIQRMGRILRKSQGKEYSKIYVIFAEVVERDVFTEEELREFEKEALSVEMVRLE